MIADLPPTEIHYTIPDNRVGVQTLDRARLRRAAPSGKVISDERGAAAPRARRRAPSMTGPRKQWAGLGPEHLPNTPLAALDRNEALLKPAGKASLLWSCQEWESWLETFPHHDVDPDDLFGVCQMRVAFAIIDEVGSDWREPYYDSAHPLHHEVVSLVRHMAALEVSLERGEGYFSSYASIPFVGEQDWDELAGQLLEVSQRLMMSDTELTLSNWLQEGGQEILTDEELLRTVCEGSHFEADSITFEIDLRGIVPEEEILEETAEEYAFGRFCLEFGYRIHELVGASSLSYTADDWIRLLQNIVGNAWHPLHEDAIEILQYDGMGEVLLDQLLFEEGYILVMSDFYRPLLESWLGPSARII